MRLIFVECVDTMRTDLFEMISDFRSIFHLNHLIAAEFARSFYATENAFYLFITNQIWKYNSITSHVNDFFVFLIPNRKWMTIGCGHRKGAQNIFPHENIRRLKPQKRIAPASWVRKQFDARAYSLRCFSFVPFVHCFYWNCENGFGEANENAWLSFSMSSIWWQRLTYRHCVNSPFRRCHRNFMRTLHVLGPAEPVNRE